MLAISNPAEQPPHRRRPDPRGPGEARPPRPFPGEPRLPSRPPRARGRVARPSPAARPEPPRFSGDRAEARSQRRDISARGWPGPAGCAGIRPQSPARLREDGAGSGGRPRPAPRPAGDVRLAQAREPRARRLRCGRRRPGAVVGLGLPGGPCRGRRPRERARGPQGNREPLKGNADRAPSVPQSCVQDRFFLRDVLGKTFSGVIVALKPKARAQRWFCGSVVGCRC